MRGSDFPSQLVHSKCASDYSSLVKKKNIQLEATGDSKNNALVAFLNCQTKATKQCIDLQKEHGSCLKSFMGMGSYKGKRNCAEELTALLECTSSPP